MDDFEWLPFGDVPTIIVFVVGMEFDPQRNGTSHRHALMLDALPPRSGNKWMADLLRWQF
jgi:hypothetical protein